MKTIENAYYTHEVHGDYEIFELGDFQLEEGGTIRECKLAYKTFGKLNEVKDNAILFPHMYSGTHKAMEIYIGEGMALDPSKYFIILPNQIGNGLSSSPHNTPFPFGRGAFPKVRISDDVRAQHKLVTEKFGINTLQLVVGWSMGAQQTYEWAVRYPEMVKRAAPIGGTAKNTPHDFLFTETLIEAITSDPAFQDGWYEDHQQVHRGLRRHSRIWAVMGLCTEFYKQEQWRRLGFSSLDDFLVGYWDNWFLPMDPNNLLCMAWKWQRGDVSRNTGGDLKAALERIQAKVYVMPFEEDMFFPVRDCKVEQEMIPNSELRVIPSLWGHFTMMGFFEEDKNYIDAQLKDLLSTPV
ncbi:alpha/beta fold hydrolase [Bacillus smithii]|uniref:alpha/beta fold hydrolase n=1 Tax=Bacillus smithii TaxID=1479 RepID=UPI0030C94B86